MKPSLTTIAVRFGVDFRQKIGQKGDEIGGFLGVGLGDGDSQGPGQAHIGVSDQVAKVDRGRLGGLKEIGDAGVEVFHAPLRGPNVAKL